MSDESPTALEELKALGATVDGEFENVKAQLVQLQGDYDAQAKTISKLQKRLIETNEHKSHTFHKWFGLTTLYAARKAFDRGEGPLADRLKKSADTTSRRCRKELIRRAVIPYRPNTLPS